MSDVEDNDSDYVYEEYSDNGENNGGESEDEVNITTVSAGSNKSSGKASPAVKAHPNATYQIAEYAVVSGVVKEMIENTASLLDIDENVAQYLLQFNRWDKEKIVEKYFANPEKVLADAGLDLYDGAALTRKFSATLPTKGTTYECRICFMNHDDSVDGCFSLGCGHKFCKEMFSEYLKNQVTTEGTQCVLAHCPEFKCHQAVTRDVFCSILNSSELEAYNRFVTKHFIESNKDMKHCPAPNCEKVAINKGGALNIICDCSYVFCFYCGEEAHEPCTCEQLSKWTEKCISDGESAKWIFANTKKCPNCQSRIEKNQGCNHMVCRSCKHNFCWLCLGTKCGHFQCVGNPQNKDLTNGGDTAAKAKRELDRYLHYYKRYQEHANAIKLADQQRVEAEKMMEEQYQKKAVSWIDVQFIKEAVEQVISCRKILKYTYVIGYFMNDKSPDRLLFERHQEMLEENVQKLHEYIYIKKGKDMDRTQVINWTRITEKFRVSLLDSFASGFIVENAGSAYVEDLEVVDALRSVFGSVNNNNNAKTAKKK